MALTATFNTATAFDMESTSDNGGTWTAIGSATGISANGDNFKVGSNSISVKLDAGAGTVRGGIQITRGTAIDFNNGGAWRGMIAFWANSSSNVTNTTNSGGFTVRVGSDASNYSEWQVSKLVASSTIPEYEGGWQRYVVYLDATPNNTTGSPDRANSDFFAIQQETSTDIMGNIQTTFFDQMDYLTSTQIGNDTASVKIKGSEVTAGNLFKEISEITSIIAQGIVTQRGGALQLTQSITLGDDGTGSSTLISRNESIIIPKIRGTAGKVFIKFVGNGTGSNSITFGTEIGSGSSSFGIGGGLIKAAGEVTFRLLANDSTATVSLFGTTIDGADAGNDSTAIDWTQTNAKMVSCSITRSGKIVLNSGAEMRDGFISASTSGTGVGAILFSSNPTDPEFRDMFLINNTHAIEWETSGTNTLDLRNIKFSGNTADIRYNHSSGLLTVNVLENSDTPTTSNGGAGGTISVVASNPITITVVEGDFTTVNPGARVGVHKASDNSEILNVITDGSGIASGTTSFTGSVIIRVRDELFNYKKVPAIISAGTGLVITIAAEDDDKYTPT